MQHRQQLEHKFQVSTYLLKIALIAHQIWLDSFEHKCCEKKNTNKIFVKVYNKKSIFTCLPTHLQTTTITNNNNNNKHHKQTNQKNPKTQN